MLRSVAFTGDDKKTGQSLKLISFFIKVSQLYKEITGNLRCRTERLRQSQE